MAATNYCFQMCAEFMRLTGVNLVDSLQEMLCRYGASLVQLARESPKKRPDLLTSAFEAVDRAKTEETKRGKVTIDVSGNVLN